MFYQLCRKFDKVRFLAAVENDSPEISRLRCLHKCRVQCLEESNLPHKWISLLSEVLIPPDFTSPVVLARWARCARRIGFFILKPPRNKPPPPPLFQRSLLRNPKYVWFRSTRVYGQINSSFPLRDKLMISSSLIAALARRWGKIVDCERNYRWLSMHLVATLQKFKLYSPCTSFVLVDRYFSSFYWYTSKSKKKCKMWLKNGQHPTLRYIVKFSWWIIQYSTAFHLVSQRVWNVFWTLYSKLKDIVYSILPDQLWNTKRKLERRDKTILSIE